MEFKDYYKSLGVAKAATQKEIKQAFRKLARKFHPDVNPGDKSAEMRFKEINEAYEVLGDPEKRKKYDELGANWRMYEQAQQAGQGPFGAGTPFGGGWNVNVGGPGGGFQTMTEEQMRDLFGGEDPFSDFFHTFFGGAQTGGRRPRAGRAPRARAGRDYEQAIDLTLEEAFQGTTRRLAATRDGQPRTVDVRIPAGVRDGSRVRAAGEGEPGTGGAAAGDLYLRIRIPRDPTFEVKGRDLSVRVPVPVTTAVLGGEAQVPTIAGGTLKLKIPPGTQQGQVFRLRGHGMPDVGKPDQRGDLYATVEVRVPRHVSDEERRHYEELARLEERKTVPTSS
jgi:curved DNA-binding protein